MDDMDFDLDAIISSDEEVVNIEPTVKEEDIDIKDDNLDLIDLDVKEEDDDTDPEKTEEIEERTDNDEGSSSTISAFVSALVEGGAFPDIDEEELKNVKTAEDLINLNVKQMQANELKDLTPLQKEALRSFRNGISLEQFTQMKSDEFLYESFTDEDLKDTDKAKQIISSYLKNNNTPDDVAKDLINSYEVDEKLYDKAKLMLPKIKEAVIQRNQNIINEREKEKQETIKEVRNTIDKTKEIFKGVELTKKEKDELFEQMKTPVKILDDGTALDLVMMKRQEDPMGFMVRLHYYAKKGLFDKEFDTSFLSKQVKKEALSKLEEQLNKGNSHNRMSGGKVNSDLYDINEIPDIKIKY